MWIKPRSRPRPSRVNTSPEAVTAYALLDPTNSTNRRRPPRRRRRPPAPPPPSTVMVPLLLTVGARAPRRSFVSSVSSRSSRPTDGRSERTVGQIGRWRVARRSWFVISARLVFDLKAVFACGVCAFLLWERERRERDGEKEDGGGCELHLRREDGRLGESGK